MAAPALSASAPASAASSVPSPNVLVAVHSDSAPPLILSVPRGVPCGASVRTAIESAHPLHPHPFAQRLVVADSGRSLAFDNDADRIGGDASVFIRDRTDLVLTILSRGAGPSPALRDAALHFRAPSTPPSSGSASVGSLSVPAGYQVVAVKCVCESHTHTRKSSSSYRPPHIDFFKLTFSMSFMLHLAV
jgi:hypothetical protein